MISNIIYQPFEHNQYCVYHTIYSGDKLPTNYIGSSSVDNINKNYHGSVKSKTYKTIWKQELKEHPELFSTVIISYHDTRPDATWKELQIQKIFNVVKNPLFINMSYASPNGYFGRDVSGENNPNFNNRWSIEKCSNASIMTSSVEIQNKIKQTKYLIYGDENYNNREQAKNTCLGKYGIKTYVNPEQAKNTCLEKYGVDNNGKIQVTCPHCNKIGGQAGMQMHHFDNCKLSPNYVATVHQCPHCLTIGTAKGNMYANHFNRCKLKPI